MFENTNKEMVREIADETMKVHRLRNIMATIKEKQMNPGPGCNGAAIMGGVEVYEKVLE